MKLVHAFVTTALLLAGRVALADDLVDPYADTPAGQAPSAGQMRPMDPQVEGGLDVDVTMDGGPRPGLRHGGPRNSMHADPALRRMLVERFDRNHDGRLEPGERRHAVRALRRLERKLARQDRRDARLRKVIRKYDLDGDGNVGPGEMPPAMAKRLRHLDHDGNGWVDDADFAR